MIWHKGGARKSWRLRTDFFLVVFLGAVLPLGLVGFWLTRSTQRSAEAYVRMRTEATLGEMARRARLSWELHRSDLLSLAESEEVVQALVSGRRLETGADGGTGSVAVVWERMEGVVDRAVFRSREGEVLAELMRPARSQPGFVEAFGASPIPVRLAVHLPRTGEPIGTLEAFLRADAILPLELLAPGVSGSVLALFEPRDGRPLLPLSMEPGVFARDRFLWEGETWLVARRQSHEPPLVMALAAPMGDFTEPFLEAGRSGVLALLAVTVMVLLLTGAVSQGLTRHLGILAEAADDVAGGRLEREVAEGGPDEVRRLAGAFNHMTASLQETLARLSHQEALAAMGELAASLAHEVRNPLTAVRLDLERASEALEEDEPASRLVRRSLRDIERLDASVGDALRLARSGRVVLKEMDLRQPVKRAMAAARPHFAAREAVLRDPLGVEEPVMVMGDASALEQLFLNLLLNAAEALSAGQEAGVRIRAASREVRVSVFDTGEGMGPEVRERVLEAFFSTKEEGTGLGLPVAHRVALAHGGSLAIESEPGRGTTVTVSLRPATVRP